MLKVPRMLDEHDPLPQLRSADGWVFSGGRKIAASKRHVAEHDPPEPQWLPVPGKPHFYTRNGKLKYDPLLPPDEYVTFRCIDALEYELLAALRARNLQRFYA